MDSINELWLEDIECMHEVHDPVECIKLACGITVSNSQITDEEIRTVVHWFGERAPDTEWEDGKLKKINRTGIGMMLFITIMEFPEFYMKYDLSQYN